MKLRAPDTRLTADRVHAVALMLQLARGGAGAGAAILLGKGLDFSTDGHRHQAVTYLGFYGGAVAFGALAIVLSIVIERRKRFRSRPRVEFGEPYVSKLRGLTRHPGGDKVEGWFVLATVSNLGGARAENATASAVVRGRDGTVLLDRPVALRWQALKHSADGEFARTDPSNREGRERLTLEPYARREPLDLCVAFAGEPGLRFWDRADAANPTKEPAPIQDREIHVAVTI